MPDSIAATKAKALLSAAMTKPGYELLQNEMKLLPGTWNRFASSSRKYHRKKDGTVPSIIEHTYEMLEAALMPAESPMLCLLGVERPVPWGESLPVDMVCFAIMLHDSLKYGPKDISIVGSSEGDNVARIARHTTNKHPKLIADWVQIRQKLYEKHFNSPVQVDMIIEALRFHAGLWSPEAGELFTWRNKFPLSFFVHMLDMMSAGDKIKVRG